MTETIRNYDGGIVARPRVVARPRTVEELQEVLRDREQFPGPVRPMGSFHSLTPCVSSAGTIVDTAGLDRVVDLDPDGLTYTAQAGMQHVRAAEFLRGQGLQFLLNVEIGNMTLGSAACCHTKDALDCVEFGQISTYVNRIKWVSPDGELKQASVDDDPDTLYMARSSHGLCGVVYEATFRVKPLEIVRFDYQLHKLKDLRQSQISDVIAQNEAMVCWTVGDTVVVQTRNRTDRVRRAWLGGARRKGWNFAGAYVGKTIRRRLPSPALKTWLEDLWFSTQKLTYRASSLLGGLSLYGPDKIVNYDLTPVSARYAFTFWAFPRDNWVENLNAYYDFSREHYKQYGFRCNMPLGSYFIKKDRASVLSYSYDGDIISLDPIHAPSEVDQGQWTDFLRAFNDWAAARGGIPLLNQSPLLERRHLTAAYGDRWDQFSRWVRDVDPEARMRNEFFDALLL